MKVDKKSLLIILSVVVVVALLLAAGALLVRGILQFNESEVRLDLAKKKLKEFYEKNPFPSNENVGREKDNVALLNDWFGKLSDALRKGQVAQAQKSPSMFMSILQAKRSELIRLANATGKVVPETFGFGFERYFANSVPPDPNDVPRLTQQFMIVEKLCGTVFSERVDALSSIVREEFEAGVVDPAGAKTGPAAARIVNKNAGVLGESDLYAKYHFVIEMKAKEKVLWNILNKFSAHEMFVVVTGVEIQKEGSDAADLKARSAAPKAATTAGERSDKSLKGLMLLRQQALVPKAAVSADEVVSAPGKSAEKPPREARIVSGPDLEKPMNVRIEIDVYRFRGE